MPLLWKKRSHQPKIQVYPSSLEEDPDVLPPTHHEMMKEVPEIDPIDENTDDSSVDSDYVPSDQEDEDFEADFVEDIHVLEGEDEVLRKEDSLSSLTQTLTPPSCLL
jgi:hypothetical protein